MYIRTVTIVLGMVNKIKAYGVMQVNLLAFFTSALDGDERTTLYS
jgi:hypothetical protein